MKRTARRGWWALAGILIGIGSGFGPQAGAQTTKPPAATSNAVAKISAQTQNGQYRIDWDGKSGAFTRKGAANEPEVKMPLTYLQADPGPNGYAKHLAWFLARDKDQFALLWCYLDDSGKSFWCWLYRYPANELITVPFIGDYQYGPPPVGERATAAEGFLSAAPPAYSGTDFVYKDWTRKSGKIDSLMLGTALANGQTLTLDPGKGSKPLTNLRVMPLHEIQVGQGNGWRPGGWRELHALAYDAANDPYYLILYSNTNIGYVLDLKRAQPYVADYTDRVKFGAPVAGFGPNGKTDTSDTPRIVRYNRFEITLTTTRKAKHPYTDINLDAEMHAPDGKVIRVPGFWDGGDTYRARFVPTSVGAWKWVILSNENDLNGKEGRFLCVAEHGQERGFLHVTPTRSNQHHFVAAGGKPFFPVTATESVSQDWVRGQTAALAPQLRTAGFTPGAADPAAQFEAFQKRIDALADMGYNRIYGDYLLIPSDSAHPLHGLNEGGEAFLQGDLDELNPAFFQAMDRRIAYCNTKGIVPNVGIGTEIETLYVKYNDLQMRRLLRYMLGRYACYDICWDLFGSNWWGKGPSLTLDPHIDGLANLVKLYDPYSHPLSTLTRFVQTATGGASAPWADVFTVPLQDTSLVDGLYPFNRPILVVDTPALAAPAPAPLAPDGAPRPPDKAGADPKKEGAATDSPDSLRARIWETRMRGGYWASARPLNDQELKWASYLGTFFKKTRYWRMEPHQEMLGGPEETPAVKRRRQKAEEEARKRNPNAPPPTDDTGAAVPSGPIYVLADPSHEYAVYFEKGGAVTLDLLEATGRIKVTWFNPRTGVASEEAGLVGGSYHTFIAPDKSDWVLYVSRH